jgi:ribulose-phosphate 3-epimerase
MSTIAPAPASTARQLLSETLVAPSLLAADHGRFAEQVRAVLGAGARAIHFDVMDGDFVPPITFGAAVVAALSGLVHEAGAIADVHLMIQRPERQIAAFAEAGADVITVHCEATQNLHHVLGAIRQAGCLAGVAINPGTPAEHVLPVAEMIDLALCMTVNPGWGGQRFIGSTRTKIAALRELLPDTVAIQVDGGIDLNTAPKCAELGANLLVAGSAVFGHAAPAAAFRALSEAVGLSRSGVSV